MSLSVSQLSPFPLHLIDPLPPPPPHTHAHLHFLDVLSVSPLIPLAHPLPPCLPSAKSSCLPSIPLTSLLQFLSAWHNSPSCAGLWTLASLTRSHSSGLWKAEITLFSPPLAAATYCAIHHTWRMINTSPSPLPLPHPLLLSLTTSPPLDCISLTFGQVYVRKLSLSALLSYAAGPETQTKNRIRCQWQ